MFAGQHILVLGLGESGMAAARLAHLYGARVTVLDNDSNPGLRERANQLEAMGVTVVLNRTGDATDLEPDLIVISPGIPPSSELGRYADSKSCPTLGELEFGFSACACPLIAVTGTNGKTTTVELLAHCLKKAGLRVSAAGNIGIPLSEEARRSHSLDAMVIEVSSFQLERMHGFAPRAAAILNVTEDHLDRHAGMATYLQTKLRLLRLLPTAGAAVLREDLARRAEVRDALPPGNPITFADRDDGCSTYVVGPGSALSRRREDGTLKPLLDVEGIHLPGRHNLENILAALALAEAAGFDPHLLAPHVASFRAGPHRLETVAIRNGIHYVNDSKATNPDAMFHALRAVQASHDNPNVHLIAGGVDKNVTFQVVEDVLKSRVKGVFLIGSSRTRLANQWHDVVSCRTYVSLEAAFDAAVEEAVSGDVVLLSPGCASQDMFGNYAQRGQAFRNAVKRRFGE